MQNQSQKCLSALVADLSSIQNHLRRIKEQNSLVEEPTFLFEFAKGIMDVETDTETLRSLSTSHKELYNSLSHFLETPWGAPFVAKCTLLEAARKLRYEEPKTSSLHEFLQKFAEFDEKLEKQIFMLLDDALKSIKSST